MTSTRRLGRTTLALLALVGCDSPAPAPTTPAPSSIRPPTSTIPKETPEVRSMPVDPAKPEEPKKEAEKSAAAGPKFTADEMAEIKKLSPEDQALAIAQMTCPVSDGKLGGMGMPLKQTVEGKTVFICCENCEKPLKEKPQEYLAKLKK